MSAPWHAWFSVCDHSRPRVWHRGVPRPQLLGAVMARHAWQHTLQVRGPGGVGAGTKAQVQQAHSICTE